MRKIFLIFSTLIASLPAIAQTSDQDLKDEHRQRINELKKEEEEGVITYKKQTDFGIKLISDGYGAFFEIGRAKSIRKSLLFQLEIDERKSAREQKQDNPYEPAPALIFGKQNFFYPVKLGVQQQILLGNKSNKNGVCVTANYGGGIALGILRPYYVEVTTDSTGLTTDYIKLNSTDSSEFLNPSDIVGGPGLGQGWSDLTVVPGLYAKGAFRFDYARYNEVVAALEIGITEEYYTQKIPIMVYSKAEQSFTSVYISIIFGGRK